MWLKSQIEKELIELKKSNNSVEEFRKAFNDTFKKVKANRIDTNVFERIFYDYIEQEYKPTTVYNFILHQITEINDKLVERLDEESNKLLEIYDFLQDEFSNDIALQSFIYGYSLANALNTESANYKSINEIMENLNKILEDVKTKE